MSSLHHTILIADDLLEIRSLIGDLLKGPSYRLIFATNGQETLDVAFTQQPERQHLRLHAGRLFDAQVVEAFLQLMARDELHIAVSVYSEG